MIAPVSDLVSPIRVRVAGVYGDWDDGFVFWASLVDDDETRSVICIDDRKGSPTRHRLFEGARLPSDPNAVLIELGAEEEGVVVPILSDWFDSPQCCFHDSVWEAMRDILLHLGNITDDSLHELGR